jgi:hypothetical protein
MEEELSCLPAGSLYRLRQADNSYYYQQLPPRGFRKKAKRVGITKNEEMIHQLARKRYVQESLKTARANLEILEKARAGYIPFDPASLRAGLGGPYSDLPLSMFTPLTAAMKESAVQNESDGADGDGEQKKYDQWHNDYRKEELNQTSHNGVPMRTKSEVNIAGRLGHFGIENVYEKPIEINGVVYRPDFTIKRPRDGKIIYWEHAGLMEDPKYRQRHEKKMIVYEDYGIVPWSNLIVTYDDASGGIDMKLVDGLIQGWLL